MRKINNWNWKETKQAHAQVKEVKTDVLEESFNEHGSPEYVTLGYDEEVL